MDDLISRAAALDVINTWGRQRSEKVRMGLLHRDLDAIPAVAAIPVEWMVSWINRHPNDLRCAWFASLEMEWQKEQEA